MTEEQESIVRVVTFFILYPLVLMAPLLSAGEILYPQTKKELQGDPYRWMENRDDTELGPWIRSQNQLTDRYLAGPLHRDLVRELEEIYPTDSSFVEEAEWDAPRRMSWRQRMVPNADAPVRSLSAKYEAQIESDSGSDFSRLVIIDRATKQLQPEVLLVKFAEVFWEEGDESFLYTTDRDSRLGDVYPAVFRHQVGSKQSADTLVYEAPEPDTWLSLLSEDKTFYLVASDRHKTRIGILNSQTSELRWLYTAMDETLDVIYVRDGTIGFLGHKDAPFGRIVELDTKTGSVVPLFTSEGHPISDVKVIGKELFIVRIENVAHRLYKFHRAEKRLINIPLPGEGSVSLGEDGGELTAQFQSYTELPSTWRYDTATAALVLVKAAQPSPVELEAERVTYRAHNGRDVVIWLVKGKGRALTIDTPVFLYGYGGFGVNILPSFWKQALPWFRRGGVVAVVTLPGGSEYGEEWHKEGAILQKKNCFDDFAAAARHLIAKGWTRPEKIVVHGRSNGGLLVGATINLYPELFRAAIPGVGVMDLMRFHLFTGGKWWVPEYGDQKIPAERSLLSQLSPYHNLVPQRYPAVLVSTADLDDRVVPSHSYKYAARLQEVQDLSRVALIQVKRGGSHSFSSGPRAEKIRQIANEWAFALKELGVEIRGD